MIGEDRGGVTWLHERHKGLCGGGGARLDLCIPVAQWKRASAGTFNSGKLLLFALFAVASADSTGLFPSSAIVCMMHCTKRSDRPIAPGQEMKWQGFLPW